MTLPNGHFGAITESVAKVREVLAAQRMSDPGLSFCEGRPYRSVSPKLAATVRANICSTS